MPNSDLGPSTIVSFRKNLKLSIQNCFSTLNSRRPFKLTMTPVGPRALEYKNMINDFGFFRF